MALQIDPLCAGFADFVIVETLGVGVPYFRSFERLSTRLLLAPLDLIEPMIELLHRDHATATNGRYDVPVNSTL